MAVRTTGIFCRPVCPARTPKRINVEFYPSSAAAFAAGYRPCLRCRPERAPAVRGQESQGAALVSRALEAIDAGALNENSLEHLSARIGVTARHLRRLFDEHLGASPLAVAQTRRLLFAKQLIEESALPLTQIAFASGFGSVRRFNDTVRGAYGRPPGSLRRKRDSSFATAAGQVQLRLGGMDAPRFAGLLKFYRARAFAAVESVSEHDYARVIRIAGDTGMITVHADERGLMLKCDFPQAGRLPAIVARVKRMFDLDAPAAAIGAHLARDKRLAPVLKKTALGVPCAWDAYELAVRAVLGQQISVAAATTLAGRMVAALGEPVVMAGAHAERLRPRLSARRTGWPRRRWTNCAPWASYARAPKHCWRWGAILPATRPGATATRGWKPSVRNSANCPVSVPGPRTMSRCAVLPTPMRFRPATWDCLEWLEAWGSRSRRANC